MAVNRMVSNQWSIGFGLRRSTIYGEHRWGLWINHGYRTWSVYWKRNPMRPGATP